MSKVTVSSTSAPVLMKAYYNATKALGLTTQVQAEMLGIHRTTLTRNMNKGLLSNPKACELQLHFVNIYRALYALTGGEQQVMRHWFYTHNQSLRATPKECCKNIHGLLRTAQYLQLVQRQH